MNIQKIQTSTKGFTLVELIVVITILVILGTIAFLNLGGFSASARDSQRTSDLNQINQQIMTMQAKTAMSYMSMLSGTVANTLTLPVIGGAASTVTTYLGGDVNYTVLGVDQAKFQDPTSKVAYKMGATSLAGTAYEIGATLEETKTALVLGTFKSRDKSTTNTASGTITAANTLTLTSGLGVLKVGDSIMGATGTGVISSISADLKTIVWTGVLTGAGNQFTLANAETTGLMGSGANIVVNKGTVLPY